MNRYVCIHGHFYQPPRENPWLEEVEVQDSSAPYHDWNARVTAQCYAPNTASRLLDPDARIIDIVNNYSRMSFNFGPTLLSWLERQDPETYRAIIEADRMSRERYGGHGSALAQVYNHLIMPLASRRDKLTQVRWGLADFRRRFGREPEGMWLAETAVDLETLDILAEHNIRFTILAPRQAARVRRLDAGDWQDVSGEKVDPTTPYVVNLASGRTIVVFFYDGRISQDLSFGDLLRSGEALRDRLKGSFADNALDWPQLVHLASDGETYGHHHAHGDMALARCLHLLEDDPEVEVVNYGLYLERHPPQFAVEIVENSSWSCVHGIERWRADCGCNSGRPGWHQKWRAPLREAMDRLRDRAAEIFEQRSAEILRDPWAAREAYIEVVLERSPERLEQFFAAQAPRQLSEAERTTVLKLLEMQRQAMLMYTSCGWFFDEISGIETVQVMQYACRAMQLAGELGGRGLEEEFTARLSAAPSNVLENGAAAYAAYVKPAMIGPLRVGAHFAISSFFENYPEAYSFGCFNVDSKDYRRLDSGHWHLATGLAHIASRLTLETTTLRFAALHPGDHNVSCGLTRDMPPEVFEAAVAKLRPAFERGDLTEVIRLLSERFGPEVYSVWHLFKDEQRTVMARIMQPSVAEAEGAARRVFEANYSLLNFLAWLGMPAPGPLFQAAAYVVNVELMRLFTGEDVDFDHLSTRIDEARKWSLPLEREHLAYLASDWINTKMDEVALGNEHCLSALGQVNEVLARLAPLGLDLKLWRAQNVFFALRRERLEAAPGPGGPGGPGPDDDWRAGISRLSDLLRVR